MVGSRYEQEAAAFLSKKGLAIREQNFRCRAGEIDLIASQEGTLVFCEVKYRYDGSAGDPAAAVDYRKQQTIFRKSTVGGWCIAGGQGKIRSKNRRVGDNGD